MENQLLDALHLLDEDEEPDPDRLKTSLITDVHTFPSKQQVLEVGSGYLDYVVVVHRLPDSGAWGVAVGDERSPHRRGVAGYARCQRQCRAPLLARGVDRRSSLSIVDRTASFCF